MLGCKRQAIRKQILFQESRLNKTSTCELLINLPRCIHFTRVVSADLTCAVPFDVELDFRKGLGCNSYCRNPPPLGTAFMHDVTIRAWYLPPCEAYEIPMNPRNSGHGFERVGCQVCKVVKCSKSSMSVEGKARTTILEQRMFVQRY